MDQTRFETNLMTLFILDICFTAPALIWNPLGLQMNRGFLSLSLIKPVAPVRWFRSVAACSSPGLPRAWSQPGDLEPLPWLRDTATTSLAAPWTSSKAEQPRAPRDRGTAPWGCWQRARSMPRMTCGFPQALCAGLTQNTSTGRQGSFPLFSWERRWKHGHRHTDTIMDPLGTSTSCLFQLHDRTHSDTEFVHQLCWGTESCPGRQQYLNTDRNRNKKERAPSGDCQSVGPRQGTNTSLPLGDVVPDGGSWQVLERERRCSVLYLINN